MEAVDAANTGIDILAVVGVGLLILGFVMSVVEIFFPALGLLGITGFAAMVIGALLVHNTSGFEQLGIHWGFVVIFILSGAGISAGGGWYAFKALQKEVGDGPQSFIGELALVIDWNGHEGHIHIDGKKWDAFGPEDLQPRDKVMVSKADGERLKVIKQ